MLMLFVLQAVAGPTLPAPRAPRPRDCPPAVDPDEVVVCGRRDDDRYRLKAPPGREPAIGIGRAEKDLGGGVSISAEAEAAGFAGAPSNRAMVRLKLRF